MSDNSMGCSFATDDQTPDARTWEIIVIPNEAAGRIHPVAT